MPVFGTLAQYNAREGRPPSAEFKVGEIVYFCLPYRTYDKKCPIIPSNLKFIVEKVENVLDFFKDANLTDDPRLGVGHSQWVTIKLPRAMGSRRTRQFSGAYFCHTPK